jgi:hypothetical protein
MFIVSSLAFGSASQPAATNRAGASPLEGLPAAKMESPDAGAGVKGLNPPAGLFYVVPVAGPCAKSKSSYRSAKRNA